MRTSFVIVISVLALAGAACSSNDGGGSSGTTGGTTGGATTGGATTGGATTGAATTGGGGGCSASSAQSLPGGKLTIQNFSFNPDCFSASANSSVSVSNKDSVTHTFTVTGTSVDITLNGGQTQTADLSSLAPGTYPFMCKIHPSMTGTLIVG
jgi:plastocyanin